MTFKATSFSVFHIVLSLRRWLHSSCSPFPRRCTSLELASSLKAHKHLFSTVWAPWVFPRSIPLSPVYTSVIEVNSVCILYGVSLKPFDSEFEGTDFKCVILAHDKCSMVLVKKISSTKEDLYHNMSCWNAETVDGEALWGDGWCSWWLGLTVEMEGLDFWSLLHVYCLYPCG